MPRDTATAAHDVARDSADEREDRVSQTVPPHSPPDGPAATGESWPPPDLGLLDEHRAAPPSFPLDALPPLWRGWTRDSTVRSGAPVDYVALSLLTAAASLVQGNHVMPAPGWAEPCALWSALVGAPSSGKTPALEAACRLLCKVEAALPHGPVGMPPALFTNGTTLDLVVDALARAGSGGTLLVRDEHGPWLSHMARGTGDGRAQAFWLSTWRGRNLEFAQRGKCVTLDGATLSILGAVHPQALERALTCDDGGVLSRFLLVRPVLSAAWQPPGDADALTPAAVAALRRLRAQVRSERDLSLTSAAQEAFARFARAHRLEMANLAGVAAGWWGKGPSQVLRLAGVLTFLEWAASAGTAVPTQVPGWALEAAIRLWRDWLWPHAQAAFRIAGNGSEAEARQRQVVRWLAATRLPEVSREHVRREALSQALDARGADRVIEALVEGGWLWPVEPPKGRRGRRPKRWLVRPELWDGPAAVPQVVGAAAPGQREGCTPDADAAGISAIPATATETAVAIVSAGARADAPSAVSAISATAPVPAAACVPSGPAAAAAPGVSAIPATGSEAMAVSPDCGSPSIVSAIPATGPGATPTISPAVATAPVVSAISASGPEGIGLAEAPDVAAVDKAPSEPAAAPAGQPLATGDDGSRTAKRARRRARRKQRPLWRSCTGHASPAAASALP